MMRNDSDTDLGTEAEKNAFKKTRHHHHDLGLFRKGGFTQKVELHINMPQPQQEDELEAVEKAATGCFKCCFKIGKSAASK